MNELKDKVAVITGAGRGIGKAIAEGFAQAGARICCSARSEEEIEGVSAGIVKAGGDAMYKTCDVSKLDDVESLFRTVEQRYGGIDIVVVNAGAQAESATVEEGDPLQWKTIVDTNLVGAYYTMRSAIPYLRRRGTGKIITIGSGAGHHGVPRSSAYSCAKAGMWMLVRVLGQELAMDKISVNEINPGPVDTEMVRAGAGAANVALLREIEWFKQPEDVVPLALYIATQPAHGPSSQSYSLLRR